ncbi:MAG: hypothetical protein U0931_26320 [Vulcanimicrobiota bacterium]
MKSKLLIVLALMGGFALGQAAVEPYQVNINGNSSKIKVGHDKDSLILPLSLPVAEAKEEWTIAVERDDKAHKLDVKITSIKRKLRGETDCYYCAANGKCAQDSPPGSGVTAAGTSEYYCNGTGKCTHCGGSGKL